jgi:hypothetical protein
MSKNPRQVRNPQHITRDGSLSHDHAGEMKLMLCPLELGEANEFVRQIHRHHGPVVGHKFSLGAVLNDKIVGVSIIGRPVARHRDDGLTLEVTRLATDGTRNACSFLYGASARATFALGYKRIGTYILAAENGASIKAAGWRLIGEAGGGSWSVPSRPRVDRHPLQKKLLFEKTP